MMTIKELENNLRQINKDFEVIMGMHYDIPTARIYKQGWNFVNIRLHENGNPELELPTNIYCGIYATDELIDALKEVRDFIYSKVTLTKITRSKLNDNQRV